MEQQGLYDSLESNHKVALSKMRHFAINYGAGSLSIEHAELYLNALHDATVKNILNSTKVYQI